jgi:hypothetical protein
MKLLKVVIASSYMLHNNTMQTATPPESGKIVYSCYPVACLFHE